MTLVVVYLYTVVAFNFFRKFYVQDGEEGEEPDRKCHFMLTVCTRARAQFSAHIIATFSVCYFSALCITFTPVYVRAAASVMSSSRRTAMISNIRVCSTICKFCLYALCGGEK